MTRAAIRRSIASIAAGVFLALAACGGSNAPSGSPAQPAPAAPSARSEPSPPTQPVSTGDTRRHDLSADESLGGHTLARHVGKTDAELADRLRRERQILAASTYSDRAIAERTVWSALGADAGQVSSWQRRSGRRPNLALHYTDRSGTIGRSLFRGARTAVPCNRAVVVLKWDDRRDRSFVLTSYPDCTR